MPQRRWLLLLVLCTSAGPAFGQSIEFLDAQGNPASTYFEGSRAYLRVADPAASTSVAVSLSAAISGDAEVIQLAETGAGVFEGEVELSISFPVPDGRLQTSRSVSQYPPTFDTLTATYAGVSDFASLVGSTIEMLDASGNPAATYAAGDTIHLWAVDVLANSTSGVDTTTARVWAIVQMPGGSTYSEFENVTLTETGDDTSVFMGSIPTASAEYPPTQNDGVVHIRPTVQLHAEHDDFNGQTTAEDSAQVTSSLPITIEWVDNSDQPLSEVYEFYSPRIRVTDGGRAGQSSLTARVTSDLRGDEEWVSLWEDQSNPGVFSGSIYVPGTLSTEPPLQDSWLEVTENAQPFQRDTIHAFLEGCSAPPCPSDSAGMIGSTIRLTDSGWVDVDFAIPGNPLYIEVIDYGIPYYMPATATVVSQSGDSETVSLPPDYIDPNAPVLNIFRQSLDVQIGPAVPGDEVLQVQELDTITASHPDPLGLSSATDSVTVQSSDIQFLDRSGNPVGFILAGGDIRVRATYPEGNSDPGAVDILTVSLRSRRSDGNVRETEPLQLFETALDTGVFTGEMPTYMYYFPEEGDGRLTVWVTSGQNDTVEVVLETSTATAVLIPSIVRITDASGTDVTHIAEGGTVHLRVESDYNNDPGYQDWLQMRVLSLTTGDEEYFNLQETGLDTSMFQGSIATAAASPVPGNGVLEIQDGETVRASHETFFGNAVDIVVIGEGTPSSSPPNAVDDAATTADDLPVDINVLANDSDPDGHSIFLYSFTQGAQGGAVFDNGGGVLTYAPPPYFTGTDTFTYRLRDQIGDEDVATVTVTVEFVNDPPSANDDFIAINEDQPALITPTDNDRDPEGQFARIVAVTQGSLGTAAIYDADLGYVSYTPNPDANGNDAFTYTIQDPQGATGTATIYFTILPQQDPPIAVNDTATAAEDTLVSISVRDNDSDVDGDTVSISNVTQGAHGQVGASATYLNYMPAPNYHGTDSFTYTINDGNGNYATATVTVTITPVPDPPVAATDNVGLNEDTPTTINVLVNDSDPDGGPLTVSAVTQGFHGSVAINANGSLTYTPAANYHGADWFNYTIVDNSGSSATARVNLTIANVNDPPNAVDDAVTTNEDTATAIFEKNNDSEPDGDAFFVSAFTQGDHGAVTFQSGLLRYTPQANYNGTDTFTYAVSDGKGGTDTATVTVTITPVRDAPTAGADAAATLEDSPVGVNVLANDSDVDGDALSVVAVTQGAHGSVAFNASSVTYTPAANFNGADSFTYSVADGTGITVTGVVVTISVASVNDPPVAVNDTATTLEDTPVTIAVLANDSDVDGDPLTVASYTLGGGAQGTLTLNSDQTLTYVPGANYNGNLGYITYQVSDGSAQSLGVVSLSITPVNDPPAAQDDSATTAEDTPVWVSVLGNDSDPENHPLAVTEVAQSANGSVAFTAGSVTYTPNNNFNGSDSFTYTIGDGNGGTATATVTVSVSAENDAPVAVADSASTSEDFAVTLSVLSNDSDIDGDPLSVTAVTQGANGSVISNAGSVTYTPNANFNGSDSFTYTIGDGAGGTATATVSITVSAINDAPDAVNDSAATNEDTAVTVSVLANDSDLDGDSLSVTTVTQGANGSVAFNAGSVTYTPNANFNGSDSFSYTIGDGNGGTATATVSITVSAINDAPVAANDSGSTNEDTAVTISVLSNDSDLDGDTLSITAVMQGAKGATTFNATSVIYTPTVNANGSDSFTYTVSDGNGGSAAATVSITINAVNDAPDAVNDSAATNEDSAVTISVLSNDTDVDGEALTITGVTQGTRGSVVQDANGTVTYTPHLNTFGSDAFTYTVRDAAGLTDTATVNVNVAAVNDPPDAANDSAATTEGTGVVITVLANDTDLEDNAFTVTVVSTPAHGTATKNANNTISYVPASTYSGSDTFTYTISDGTDTDTATVTVQIKDVIGNVAVLGTHGVWIQTGADVLSGDVIANDAGSEPFLNGTEVSIAGTTAAGWDVQGNRVTIASGAGVASDVYYNQLSGTVGGAQYTPLSLPVFVTLPSFQSASPGSTDVNVGNNGNRTLAPGSYRDLIVGRKGTVTFTGGTYHFRSIRVDREAKLLFSAASTVRVQQKMSTSNLTTIGPGAGSPATAGSIVFHVGGINGTGGGLAETPKAIEIGVDNTLSANLYAPNGTIWLKDRTVATGAYIGRDVQVGVDGQVTLSSAW